jgi:transposase
MPESEKGMGRKTASGTKKKKNSHIFKRINFNAAGIDAGAEEHWVAVPEDRATPAVRKFSTMTVGLYELADWLVECGIDTVAVEATGVYCVPLLEVLDARGIKVVLAKPSSLKSINDCQKTDFKDCQWIQMLHTFGLLKASYRPTQMVATFRSYTRQRRMLIEYASSSIEHMKKALTQMNVRLDQAVSDVTGVTGMAIIRAILAGERDPVELAKLRDDRCSKSEGQIAQALTGKYCEEHLFELDQAVRTWDHYQGLIAECNKRIEAQANRFPKTASREDIPDPRRVEHVRKNVLTFEARELFFEVLGQDLTQIDGISTGTVSTFLAEIGTSMEGFRNFKHFASWLRLSPGSHKSGGKSKSGKNRRTTNRFATALRVAAQTLERSKSALGAFYRRMKARLGPPKAINATAHKLARMIYFILKEQRPYVDPGADYYDRKNEERVLKHIEKRARQLGYQLVKAA